MTKSIVGAIYNKNGHLGFNLNGCFYYTRKVFLGLL